jgi:hypothetical protein
MSAVDCKPYRRRKSQRAKPCSLVNFCVCSRVFSESKCQASLGQGLSGSVSRRIQSSGVQNVKYKISNQLCGPESISNPKLVFRSSLDEERSCPFHAYTVTLILVRLHSSPFFQIMMQSCCNHKSCETPQSCPVHFPLCRFCSSLQGTKHHLANAIFPIIDGSFTIDVSLTYFFLDFSY